jgi:AraC-like DNA-binding protein
MLQIAMKLGYSEHSHFTRRFKAKTGMTPTAFARADCHRESALTSGASPVEVVAISERECREAVVSDPTRQTPGLR